jgi:polyisoprenoid-binding protein YceI
LLNRYMCSLLGLGLLSASAADQLKQKTMEVSGGVVKFEATTNLSAVSIHGQSSDMKATATLLVDGGKLSLETVKARVDPNTLKTGMQIRDQHMKNKIFTDAKGTMPELMFTANGVSCEESSCKLNGELTLRGTTHPAAFSLKMRGDAGKGYKVSAESVIKLSAFGIEPPCQLGVCVVDDVRVKLEFQAREGTQNSQLTGARR